VNVSLEKKLAAGFGLAFCVLLALGISQYRMTQQLVQSGRRIAHTNEILTRIEHILDETRLAESGVRGYIIKGDPEMLGPFRTARTAVPKDLEELKALLSDSPGQWRRADELQRLMGARFGVLQKSVELRDTGGLGAVQAYAPTPSGSALMNRMAAVANQMKSEETALLQRRSAAADESAARTSDLVLAGTVVALGLLTLAGMVIRRDAVERRKVQQALEKSEKLYESLFESAADLLILTDRQGYIVRANAQAERAFGYGRRELTGQTLEMLVPQRFRRAHERHRSQYMFGPRTRPMGAGLELFGLRKDGTEFPVDIMLSVSHAWDEPLVQSVIRDVTERKQAQQEIAARAQELARSNADLENFAYVASHDLQEPLRMVSSYTQLLGERYRGKLDAEADEFIAFAVDGAARMQVMIQDLLNYSRVARKPPQLEPVDSQAVLGRALSNLQASIQESGAEISAGPLPMVKADAAQLLQLFQNLIGNAIKFRGTRQPTVEISASRNGGWTFRVSDNGIGIDPHGRERIFGMFQRLHTRKEYPGTGIGLAVCKRVVEGHGGKLWVESEPGRGSSFFFTLPA
jgi:PAS domain S-box-containing protein